MKISYTYCYSPCCQHIEEWLLFRPVWHWRRETHRMSSRIDGSSCWSRASGCIPISYDEARDLRDCCHNWMAMESLCSWRGSRRYCMDLGSSGSSNRSSPPSPRCSEPKGRKKESFSQILWMKILTVRVCSLRGLFLAQRYSSIGDFRLLTFAFSRGLLVVHRYPSVEDFTGLYNAIEAIGTPYWPHWRWSL